jgi:hypothetical protein
MAGYGTRTISAYAQPCPLLALSGLVSYAASVCFRDKADMTIAANPKRTSRTPAAIIQTR